MSDVETPAALLRRAAEHIENAAAEATPRVCPEWTYHAVRHIARNCEIECYHPDGADPNVDHDGWSRYGDSPWIAAVGAEIAPALAASLRSAAAAVESYPGCANPGGAFADVLRSSTTQAAYRHTLDHVTHALALARAILREDAGAES